MRCPECSKEGHFYINGTSGAFYCQRCGFSGGYNDLRNYFEPAEPYANIYEKFHELSVRLLAKDKTAREYVLSRGFTEESLVAYRYGYSDERVYKKLLEEFSRDELIEARLWVSDEEKGFDFPYFSNHIILPYMRGGRYVTFQGRNLDEHSKKRYIFLPGHPPCLYHAEDLSKRGRVYLVEGAFKRDRMVQEGEKSVGLPGANNWKKFVSELNRCDDLWVLLDADANEVGQKAALEITKSLKSCTVVTLPLTDGEEKIGPDDFIEQNGIEALRDLSYKRYEYGVEKKPTSLRILVADWKERVQSAEKSGYETGHERLDSWLGGFHNGSLAFVAGGPHYGKSVFLEDVALRLYKNCDNLTIDYYSNDDSLFTTITRLIAKMGRLEPKEVRYAGHAYKDRPDEMRRFEAAVERLAAKSDRLQILDRSYNIQLETLKDELAAWRQENPQGEKAVFIDAFTKTMTRRDSELKDEMSRSMYKSSLLKEIAQQAHIPIVCSTEVPKLGGKRPNSWNLRGPLTLEYDADVILLFYQEAHVRGIDRTSIKIEYPDAPPNPILEVSVGKDKIAGTAKLTDLFEIRKDLFGFQEVADSDYYRLLSKVKESERAEHVN